MYEAFKYLDHINLNNLMSKHFNIQDLTQQLSRKIWPLRYLRFNQKMERWEKQNKDKIKQFQLFLYNTCCGRAHQVNSVIDKRYNFTCLLVRDLIHPPSMQFYGCLALLHNFYFIYFSLNSKHFFISEYYSNFLLSI